MKNIILILVGLYVLYSGVRFLFDKNYNRRMSNYIMNYPFWKDIFGKELGAKVVAYLYPSLALIVGLSFLIGGIMGVSRTI